MHLKPDDEEAGARENFDHAAGPLIRELEIVRLDQHEGFFDLRVFRELDHLIEDSAVAIREFRPKVEVAFHRRRIERRQRGRFKVNDLAGIVRDVIAEGVADRFAARPFVHDVTDGVMDFFHGIGAAENEHQRARSLSIDFSGEIFQNVIANQFLGSAMARLSFGHDCLGVTLRQFRARGENPRRDEIESRPRNQAGDDPTGVRFAHRVGRNDDVGKLFGWHAIFSRAAVDQPRRCRKSEPPRGRGKCFPPFPPSTLFQAHSARIAIHFPRRRTSETSKAFCFSARRIALSWLRKIPERIKRPPGASCREQAGNVSIRISLKRFAAMM